MIYTTTSCPNCGFRTRNHESNVPKMQLGAPVLRCPNCGNLILDNIAVEFEFMTDRERAKFTSDTALAHGLLGNISFILLGFFLLFVGIAIDDVIVSLFAGGGSIALGISNLIRNNKLYHEHILEQAVYESLQRTKNKDYVEFIEQAYLANKIKRHYRAFDDKNSFMEMYQTFENRESYIKSMQDFEELTNLISVYKCVDESNSDTFFHP